MTYGVLIAGALAAAGVATGCGGDDGGETDAACDAFVAIDEASINDDIEGMISAIEGFVASAPDGVARQVQPLVPLLQADPEAASESRELVVAETASDEWALETCADRTVELEAFNFAFPDVPAELEAGRVAFTMRNRSQTDEAHEALLLRKNDDVAGSAHDALAAGLEGGPVSVENTLGALEDFEFVGASLVEPPGGDDYDVIVVDLEPGDYIVACLLPLDSAGQIEAYFSGEEVHGEYHLQRGMFAEFTVS
jgi:hypothetical protein